LKDISSIQSVSKLEIIILVENSTYNSKVIAEHGLSVLLLGNLENGDQFKILFDTGLSGNVLMHNLKQLDINVNDLDALILSHGHYDHTGGLEKFLEQYNKSINIICHPNVFDKKFAVKDEKAREIGIPFNRSRLEELGAVFQFSTTPTMIKNGIFTSGEIPRETNFELVPDRFKTMKDGCMVHDTITDDLALFIKMRNELVVITGCAHSGIINTINHAVKITNLSRISGVFGGFHLFDSEYNKIKTTIDHLREFDIDYIGGCHCTGLFAISCLINEYIEQYRECSTGSIIRLYT